MVLKDRFALIVGGGNGLGRSVAHAFLREGAMVAVADLDRKAAEETLAQVQGEIRGLAIEVDIADPAACNRTVERVVREFGRLDLFVNCAAICLVDPILEVPVDRWDRVVDVNLRGAFFCMQAAARSMIPNRFGRIINISTPASRSGTPFFASYSATKAAVESLSRSAAVALAPYGITVNCVVPGQMTGGMIERLERDLSRLMKTPIEELQAQKTATLPFGRRVRPEEVAEAAVWLASDAAAYVTAERLNFTGGVELS